MTSAAPQLDFFAALFNPLVSRAVAGELLDGCSEDHVQALIDAGTLHAVNIALRTDTVRTLRVWRWSLDAQRYPRIRAAIGMHGPPPLATLLPHQRERLTTAEVRRFLGCSDQHVVNLHHEGLLAGTRDGAVRLLRIERASLLAFLNARTLTP
jgi:excisionase family DNA binding protein